VKPSLLMSLFVAELLVGLVADISMLPTARAHQLPSSTAQPSPASSNPSQLAATSTAVAVIDAANVSTVEAATNAAIADANRRAMDAQATAEALNARLAEFEQPDTQGSRRAFLGYVILLLAVCLNVALAIAYAYESEEGVRLPITNKHFSYGKQGIALVAFYAVQIAVALLYTWRLADWQ
jgi:hypothetical protein